MKRKAVSKMASIGTIKVDIKWDDFLFRRGIWHWQQIWAKYKRESRISYRLKKWFIGLRPVNNWLWRRGNKEERSYEPFDHVSECIRSVCTENCSVAMRCMDHVFKKNTAILPDYPSIRELSTELSEEAQAIQAANEALEKNEFVTLEEMKRELSTERKEE
jgi:hypothetical protein